MSVDTTAIRRRAAPVVKRFELTFDELRDRARSVRPSSFTTAMSQVAAGAHAGDASYLRWLELLDEGVRSGALRGDLDTELVFRFIRDTVWVAVRWYRPGGPMTAQDVADQYLAILLDGIAPRSGGG